MDRPELNIPLSNLKETAKTADEKCAAEQFDLARDALRRGSYHEAFTAIQKAINGDESHAGQGQNFRFQFLLGILRLGSFQHHDPSLLDLDLAEQAFVTAGHSALAEFPLAAARAYLAAGWSSYCQGRSGDTAAQHTQKAIMADPTLAEAHFQMAKIAMHRREPDVAQSFLAQAIQFNPAFAEAAFHDGDFLPFTAVVVDVVKSVRDAMGRQASKALHEVNRRAAEVDVDSEDPTSGSGTEVSQSVTTLIMLIRTAQRCLTENTFHGNLRTLASVDAAFGAIKVLRARVQNERVHATEAIQRASEELGRLAAINIGGYRLNESSHDELAAIQALLDTAAKSLARATLDGYLESQAETKQAMDLIQRARDGYRESALEQATSEYEALELQIEGARRQSASGSVKGFALLGAFVALFPGGLLNLIGLGSGAALRWSELVMHLSIAAIVGGTIGAVVGRLLAEGPAESAPTDGPLEQRRATLRQAVADLKSDKR